MRKELSNQQRVETAGGNKSKAGMRRSSGVYNRDKSPISATSYRRSFTSSFDDHKFAF